MDIIQRYLDYLNEIEPGWEAYPKGWDKHSVKKAGYTLGKEFDKKPTDKGYFEKCVEKMKGKIDNPEGYCASLKDYAHGSTYWRNKKSEKEVKKAIAAHPKPQRIK